MLIVLKGLPREISPHSRQEEKGREGRERKRKEEKEEKERERKRKRKKEREKGRRRKRGGRVLVGLFISTLAPADIVQQLAQIQHRAPIGLRQPSNKVWQTREEWGLLCFPLLLCLFPGRACVLLCLCGHRQWVLRGLQCSEG